MRRAPSARRHPRDPRKPTNAHSHSRRRSEGIGHRSGARARRRPGLAQHDQGPHDRRGRKSPFTIELTTPACPLKDEIQTRVDNALAAVSEPSRSVGLGRDGARRDLPATPQLLPGVKNIVAVASGKGGVGQEHGERQYWRWLWPRPERRWAFLGRRYHGPNIPMMMGAEGQPVASASGRITPIVSPRRQGDLDPVLPARRPAGRCGAAL